MKAIPFQSRPSETYKTTRNPYWDAVKGLCIVAVIWIHARTGQSYLDTPTSWNFDYWVILRQFLNFPVAIFFFLAGYFINASKLNSVGAWLKPRLIRLLLPFLVWSIIYGGLASLLDIKNIDFLGLLFRVLTGSTVAHLYFIVVLVQLTLITPWLVRAVGTRWGWIIFLITPIYIGVIYFNVYRGGDVPWWYAHLAVAWVVFYYAGIWVRQRGFINIRLIPASILVVLSFLASVVEAYFHLAAGAPDGLAVSQLSFTSICYAFSLTLFLFALKPRLETKIPASLRKLGNDSYGIYYVHLAWIVIINYVIRSLPGVCEPGGDKNTC